MKKIIASIIIMLLCISLFGCSQTQEIIPTEEPTKAHSIAPTEEYLVEPEWAPIDCNITLNDKDNNIVVPSYDFLTFALEGSTDEDSRILLKLSDEATDMLKQNSESLTLTLTINDTPIEDVVISPDTFNGEFEIGASYSYQDTCDLATTIRGLFN